MNKIYRRTYLTLAIFAASSLTTPVHALSQIRFHHKAEICFEKDRISLSNENKITLIRSLYELLLTEDLQRSNISIYGFGDPLPHHQHTKSEEMGKRRANEVKEFLLSFSNEDHKFHIRESHVHGVPMDRKDRQVLEWCTSPVIIEIFGVCSDYNCKTNWKCTPNGCESH